LLLIEQGRFCFTLLGWGEFPFFPMGWRGELLMSLVAGIISFVITRLPE
jgi:hypothetical protein